MFDKKFALRISCEEMDQQLPSLVQVITSVFPFICVVEDLYIYGSQYTLKQWQDDTENSGWLEIFHPFAALKNLYVCKKFARRIAPALQELVRACYPPWRIVFSKTSHRKLSRKQLGSSLLHDSAQVALSPVFTPMGHKLRFYPSFDKPPSTFYPTNV